MAATVQHNRARSRYEISVDDRVVGFADYQQEDDTFVFPHTEIEWSMRGQGLGAELVRYALDDVRRNGGTVVAQLQSAYNGIQVVVAQKDVAQLASLPGVVAGSIIVFALSVKMAVSSY